jgi:hypothetical protein
MMVKNTMLLTDDKRLWNFRCEIPKGSPNLCKNEGGIIILKLMLNRHGVWIQADSSGWTSYPDMVPVNTVMEFRVKGRGDITER